MIGRIFNWARQLKNDGLTLLMAMRDPRTPWRVKAVALATAAYVVSPIDLIPDFLLVLGIVDDAIVVQTMVRFALRMVPIDVRDDCRRQAERSFAWPLALARRGALVVAALWVAAIALVAWAIWWAIWG